MPKIFLVTTKDQFDLAMLFWRYQEYYESPNKSFYRKSFTLIDHMKWYSKNIGEGSFSYAYDWAGFNIPSFVVTDCIRQKIKDRNIYDNEMLLVYKNIFIKNKMSHNFYIIGCPEASNKKIIQHELAHGLFATNKAYKKDMLRLVKQLPAKKKQAFNKILTDMSYNKTVHDDEIQAYCSTGLYASMKVLNLGKSTCKAFKEVYIKYAFSRKT